MEVLDRNWSKKVPRVGTCMRQEERVSGSRVIQSRTLWMQLTCACLFPPLLLWDLCMCSCSICETEKDTRLWENMYERCRGSGQPRWLHSDGCWNVQCGVAQVVTLTAFAGGFFLINKLCVINLTSKLHQVSV